MNCIFIRRLALPGTVRGVAVAAPDDDFVVFVNESLCPDAQREAAEHELRHIRLDHFYDDEPVVISELEAR
ncbi:hypothetical protein [Candidatus Allofournierella merdipullorum]|uniref:hypothetical protein n=1 Tax=Candidatus Allofournierella merdipullorum TaxID=2838595 RepID=UPI002A88FC68|nr:hypothetical protein [Candidatus Fournierella merdipullorum]